MLQLQMRIQKDNSRIGHNTVGRFHITVHVVNSGKISSQFK